MPSALSVVRFTHKGASNFAVWIYQDGDKDLLVNTIGSYSGTRPIFKDAPAYFDITADGAWTIDIVPLGLAGDGAPFSGKGDDVSGVFAAPDTGAWTFTHDGDRNFAVWLHCDEGSDLIQNEIGQVDNSHIVEFNGDLCFWEVEADGSWALAPRG